MDDETDGGRWWTVAGWVMQGSAWRQGALAVLLFAALAGGLSHWGAQTIQALIGAAFALMPAWALLAMLLAGGQALALGWADRLRLQPERLAHRLLVLGLSALAPGLLVLVFNVGGGVMPYRGG